MGEVKGWCPGALRPMMSGDGLLVRLRLTGGVLSFTNARAIAGAAARFGNGKISLSARANLQLRGVSVENYPQLIAELQALGLVGDNAQAEAVRNIIASPLPDGLVDIAPVVSALDARLATDETLWALPGKFGFAIDNGSTLPLGDVSADVRFEAVMTPQGARFGLVLAGAEQTYFGFYTAAQVPDIAADIARMFITAQAQHPALKRMKDWVRLEGDAITALPPALMLRLLKHEGHEAPLLHLTPRTPQSTPAWHQILGAQSGFYGVAAPFGLLDASSLHDLAETAEASGARDLRLTPWRVILAAYPHPNPLPKGEGIGEETLPKGGGIGARYSLSLWERVRVRAGFITNPADPRLSIAACTGAPACSSGETPAMADAQRLAPLFAGANHVALHVSGCGKGCAHPGKAPLTLVGRGGLYDLIEHGDTKATPIRTGLAPAQLPEILSDIMRIQSFDA